MHVCVPYFFIHLSTDGCLGSVHILSVLKFWWCLPTVFSYSLPLSVYIHFIIILLMRLWKAAKINTFFQSATFNQMPYQLLWNHLILFHCDKKTKMGVWSVANPVSEWHFLVILAKDSILGQKRNGIIRSWSCKNQDPCPTFMTLLETCTILKDCGSH